jgi:hypothetical protein
MEEGLSYGAAVCHFQSADENMENYQPPDPYPQTPKSFKRGFLFLLSCYQLLCVQLSQIRHIFL